LEEIAAVNAMRFEVIQARVVEADPVVRKEQRFVDYGRTGHPSTSLPVYLTSLHRFEIMREAGIFMKKRASQQVSSHEETIVAA
jgi:hypothetical protein